MAIKPDYTTGTITLTSGSANFTSTGAALQSVAVQAGDEILLPAKGLVLVIDTITGENSGTLVANCPADAAGAAQPMRIRFQTDISRVTAAARALIEKLADGKVESLANLVGVAGKGLVFNSPTGFDLIDFALYAQKAVANTWPDVQTFSAIPVLSGGGIKFPATQVPSADVNVLDDYEEGTWTPTINFATSGNLIVAYSSQSGNYVKIGKAIVYSYLITTSTFTHTTAMGLLYIGPLPFGTGSNFNGSGSCAMSGYTKAGYTTLGHETGNAGQTRLYVQVGGSGLPLADLFASDVPSGGTIRLYGSGTYIAA